MGIEALRNCIEVKDLMLYTNGVGALLLILLWRRRRLVFGLFF